MAEENVKVDLQSTADTSGFEKFEASYNSLAAAKRENITANGLFVDSERRVRTNLADLVTGLGSARDGTQAVSVAIGHLSEVFQIGFAGTVVAGVGAALISQFSKVTEEIEKTEAAIKKTGEDLDELGREIEGKRLTPTEERAAKLQKTEEALAQERAETASTGVFKMIRLGISNLFGGTMGEDLRKQEAEINRRQLQAFNLTGRNAQQNEDARLDAILTPAPKAKVQNVAFEQLVKEQEDQQDFDIRQKKVDAEKAAAARRLSDEMSRAAEKTAKEAEKAAAASDREAEKERTPGRPGRVEAHIYAGSQRQYGGGGGVYSVITRDPVVAEARKHTELLTDIANSVKTYGKPSPAISGALA